MIGVDTPLSARLSRVVVTLRSELDVTRTLFRGEPSYIVRDPITFQAHKLEPDEYQVFIALDRGGALGEIFASLVEEGRLVPEDAEGFYDFIVSLYRIGLLNLPIPDHSTLYERFELKERMQRKQKLLGFAFMQVPLLSPDAFLDRTVRYVRPLFSRAGFAIWGVLMAVMLSIVVARWSDLTQPILTLLDLGNLPWLALILVSLKALHELGHAYSCKHFGGRVPEMGAIFIVGTPCAYVDASAAWGFSSKLQRIFVSLAGMYVEVAIGAIALITWAMTDASFLNSLAYQVFMMSTVVTVLFNVNPLMRFDGYYVLSDLVEVPNLRARSQERVVALLKRLALGVKSEASCPGGGIGAFLTSFGIASALYKFTLVIAISALIASKIYFLGVAVAAIYLGTTFVGIASKMVSYLLRSEETAPTRVRAACVGLLLAGLLPVGFAAVPVPLQARSTGIITALDETVLRAQTGGFLEWIDVQVGESVERGQPVVRLANSEALERLSEARAELEILELEVQHGAVLDRHVALQKEMRRSYFEGLLQRALEEARGLDVTADADGTLLRLDCTETPGTFLEEGSQIGLVGRGPWVGRLLVDEETFTHLRVDVGDQVPCRAWSEPGRILDGEVMRVSPAATHDVVQLALTSLGGGSIVVDPQTKRSERAYFEILLTFCDDDRVQLRHGMTIVAELDARPRTLARHAYVKILSFLDGLRLG